MSYQQQVYRMTLGTDLQYATIPAYQIAGIRVDNPSGSWLYVTGVNQYVPPYVNGWSFPIAPEQASVSVKFVDSPSGSVSQQVGSPPIVTLYNYNVPAFQGVPSGSGAKVTTNPNNIIISTQVVADGTFKVVIPTPATTQRIILRRVSAIYSWTYARTWAGGIMFQFAQEGWVPGNFQSLLSISPESPTADRDFEDGSVILDVGKGLSVSGLTEANAFFLALGDDNIQAEAQFYLVNA